MATGCLPSFTQGFFFSPLLHRTTQELSHANPARSPTNPARTLRSSACARRAAFAASAAAAFFQWHFRNCCGVGLLPPFAEALRIHWLFQTASQRRHRGKNLQNRLPNLSSFRTYEETLLDNAGSAVLSPTETF